MSCVPLAPPLFASVNKKPPKKIFYGQSLSIIIANICQEFSYEISEKVQKSLIEGLIKSTDDYLRGGKTCKRETEGLRSIEQESSGHQ
jgi:hypothetical protein